LRCSRCFSWELLLFDFKNAFIVHCVLPFIACRTCFEDQNLALAFCVGFECIGATHSRIADPSAATPTGDYYEKKVRLAN
jgi:hypothetical protein